MSKNLTRKGLALGAIVALGAGHLKALVFILAMLAGMALCNQFFTGHKK